MEIYLKKIKIFVLKIYQNYIFSLSKILKNLGININTIPVLDVLRKNTNKIIGNRSFSKDKKIVKELGKLTVKYFTFKKKFLELLNIYQDMEHLHQIVIKKLPKVKLHLKKLNKIDFYPFKLSNAKLAMTAHILYTKIDNKNVATHSKKIIKEIIRKKLGFKGILISDDISMKALKYDLITNAKKSIEAGCNLFYIVQEIQMTTLN